MPCAGCRAARAARALDSNATDMLRLRTIWGDGAGRSGSLADRPWKKRLAVRMLGGSLMDYERATLRWWWHIEDRCRSCACSERPVYFVSSNIHSLVNLLSGFALRNIGRAARLHPHARASAGCWPSTGRSPPSRCPPRSRTSSITSEKVPGRPRQPRGISSVVLPKRPPWACIASPAAFIWMLMPR